MTVTWTDASNNEDRFDIQSAETADFANPVAANVGAGVGTFTINNLQSCRTYFVRVSAANSAGSSAWIDGRLTLNPNVPGKAASLAAITASQTQINLVWTFTANTEEAFELEYADNSGYTGSTKRDLAKASRTENVTGLKVATKYWFRLRGKNCGGNGDWLESTATTLPNTPQPPIAPTNLVATAVSDSEISLTWTDNSDETGFDVERSPNGVTGWDYIRTTAANETTFKDNGLMALTRYVYRVQARRIDFTSPYSNTATATTLAPPIVAPAAPANLKATAASSNQINLNWDVANGLTGYKLEYADNAGFTNLKTESSLAGSATTFVLQNLLPDTPYFIRLYAVNSAGTSAATGQARTPATPVTLPAAPSVLTIKTAGMGQLEVRWTDNATNEETYELDYSTDTSFGAGLTQLRLAANESNRNLTGLADNTTYHLRVRATNKAGASVWLAGSEKTLPATPSSLQPPINLRFNVSAPVFNQLSLLWNDVATTETGYEVWRSVNDQTNWTRLAELPTNTVAYDDKNLRAGVPYFYRVRAVQNTILSDWSNSITDQSPLVNAINAPAEVRVYPNPATDRLTVAHPLRGPLLVRLVSSQGLVVLEQFDAGIVGTVSLEVSSVPTGFYLLLLSGETTRFSIPILKY